MQQTFGEDLVSITQGSSRDIKILIRYPDGEAFDLTDVTEVKGIFPGRNSLVNITLAAEEIEILDPPARGALVLTLSPTKTALLKPDARMTFEIEIKTALKTHVVQFKQMLDVEQRIS